MRTVFHILMTISMLTLAQPHRESMASDGSQRTPPLTPRVRLPLVIRPLQADCVTTQPSTPPAGLWSFVMNFDSAAPLRGCLIDYTGTTITYTLVTCAVNNPQHVAFFEEGARKGARFDGQGSISCPYFDPPGVAVMFRQRKTFLAVVKPVSGAGLRQNPLLFHPYTSPNEPDVAWSLPVLADAPAPAVAYQSTMRIGGQLKFFTTTVGLTIDAWNIVATDSRLRVSDTIVTHTVNTAVTQVFTPTGDIFFNAAPVTISIAYDPGTQQYFKGDLDELILDPRAISGGN
jgi:hypothetical protein